MSNKKNILFIFGTRPEVIKLAPVILELKKYPNKYNVIVCNTEQQKELSNQTLSYFGLKADINLDVMRPNQTLSEVQSRILTALNQVYNDYTIDATVVQGDTMTVLCGALSSFYRKIPVFHVEAGLRSYDIYEPFPEEVMRQMTSRVTELNFAPTEKNRQALLKENIDSDKIFVTGNTVIDAMKTTVTKDYYHPVFEWLGNSRMILLTAHRRENLGEPMRHIFTAIKRIVDEFSDVKVVYPIHLNPKIREIANEVLGNSDKVKIIEPLEVFDFHNFQNKAYLILTDSGGVQEEAPSLGKPVLVLRDTTERPEGIEAGTLKLVGTDTNKIYEETKLLLTNKEEYEKMAKSANPYGDGFASKYIVDAIIEKYKVNN